MPAPRKTIHAACLAAALLCPAPSLAQDAAEAACREHLEVLGAAYGRFLVMTGGKPPARLSDFFTQGIVLDLDTFTCPASSNRITDAKQIDERTSYEVTTTLADKVPMLLLRERHGLHDGHALAFYSDRTFKKTSALPPANVAATPPVTNVPPAAATNAAGTSLVLTNPLQQSLAFDFLGKEHARNGRWAEAEAAFREVVQRAPTNTWNHYNLAYALSQQGRWKEAEGPSREALRLQPTNVLARVMLGHALGYQSNWSGAGEAFREAIRLDATNAVLRMYLGNTLRSEQKMAEAEAAFRTAAGLEPGNPRFQLELAHACVAQGKWKDAEGSYREVLRLDPNNAWAHGGLGHVFMGQNRLTEAETSYRVAIKSSPNFAQFHADLGGTLLRLGRRDEARAAAQQGVRLGCRQHWVYREVGLNP